MLAHDAIGNISLVEAARVWGTRDGLAELIVAVIMAGAAFNNSLFCCVGNLAATN